MISTVLTDDETEQNKKGIARHASLMADEFAAKAIIVFSYSGRLASYLSAFKPNQPVFSFTENANTHYSLGVNYGVFSKKVDGLTGKMSEDQEKAIATLKAEGILESGDAVVVVGARDNNGEKQPQMRVVTVK